MLTIEICPNEPRADFVDVSGYENDVSDCTSPGDAQEACEYIRDQIGVTFHIIARNALGEYGNRKATEGEIEATARAIYFESDSDFSDMETAATYLIWESAINFKNDSDYGDQ